MADNPAAPAPANADAPATSPSDAPASSRGFEQLSKELNDSTSFDVESLLAGDEPAEPVPTKEKPDGEEPNPENPADGTTPPEGEETPEEVIPETEDEELKKSLKPRAQKRFDQLLAQRDQALADLRTAQQERDDAKNAADPNKDAPTPVQVASDPLAKYTTEADLSQQETFLKGIRTWIRRNPGGGDVPADVAGREGVTITPEQMPDYLDFAETMLEKIPARRDFLAKFGAAREATRKTNPEMFQAGTPAHAAAEKLRTNLLNFHTLPDQDDIVAKLIKLETMEREEREGVARYTRVEVKKPANPAPAPAKPVPKPTPTARPAAAPVKPASATGLTAKLNQKEGVDIEELFGD